VKAWETLPQTLDAVGPHPKPGARRKAVGNPSAIHAAPPHTDGMHIRPGRATPSQTRPPGGDMGKPGFPLPMRGGGLGKPGFPRPLRTGCALPNPPASGGRGKSGFPLPLREGQALLRAGAWGNRVSPHPGVRA